MEFDVAHAHFAATESPLNYTEVFHSSSGSKGGSPLPAEGVNSFSDTNSNFDGQSPAPFTAPSSPITPFGNDAAFKGFSKTDQQSILSPDHEPAHVFASPPPFIPPSFQRSNTTDYSEIMTKSPRIRYRQQEENEHRQRLAALLRQYGPDHPATIDTYLRLGAIMEDQGRYGSAESLFSRAIKGYQKTFGDDHPATIIGRSFDFFLYLEITA